MVRTLEFDVSEMAFTTYLVAKAHGVRFTALPVFLVRGFHHGAVLVNRNAGIRDPKQLAGQRIGVNRGYTVTTGVWARGILAEEYGVDLDAVTWVLSGDEHVASYLPPANVVSMPEGGDLKQLLLSGEIAAAIGIDSDDPDVVPLLDDPQEAGLEALRRTGSYPINHLVVVKDEVLEAHPDLAVGLFTAFSEAKNRYVEQLRAGSIAAPTAADRMYAEVLAQTGSDPLPYGIGPNRTTIDRLLDHAVSQHILESRPSIESLFAAPTLGLTG
jgi:4,5-dihydroxyphthalate decarboxylase